MIHPEPLPNAKYTAAAVHLAELLAPYPKDKQEELFSLFREKSLYIWKLKDEQLDVQAFEKEVGEHLMLVNLIAKQIH